MADVPESAAGGKTTRELTAAEVRDVLAGVLPARASTDAFDVRAAFAAIAMVESLPPGNVNSVGDTTLASGPSYGLWQVLRGSHPKEAAAVQAIISMGLAPAESARRQAIAILPVLNDAAQGVVIAASRLEARGFTLGEELLAGLLDACWNHGPGRVIAWAESTVDADLRKFHARVDLFLDYYRKLALAVAGAAGMGFGLVLLLGWIALRGRR